MTIKIQFNGESKEFPEETTIKDLIQSAGMSSKFCAVELNEEIIPKSEYATLKLNENDQIEIVTLVGGG